MQVKDQYDLIVIGDQLSGLFLAAGAAQAGFHVLVLEGNSAPTVNYELPSGRLLGDLLAEPVIGIEENSKVDSFLRSLGLYKNLSDVFPLHHPALQLVLEKKRFQFCYDMPSLKKELEREFGFSEEKAEIFSKAFLGLIVSKKNFIEVLAALDIPVSNEILAWMQTVLFGSLAPSDLPYPLYKEVVDLAAKGVRYPLGGKSALKERLMSRILVYGGTIKRAARVEEIVFEKDRLAGVLLSSYEGFVRSKNVIGAMGAKTFYELLPEKMRPKKLAEAVNRLKPKFWRMNFTLLLSSSILPEGLGTHVVLRHSDETPDQDNFLQIQIFDKETYGGIPGGHKALVCRVLVPFEEDAALNRKYVGRVLKRSLKKLEEVIPFLYEKPFYISPDPEKLDEDLIFQKFYCFKSLEHIPPSYLVYESTLDRNYNQSQYMDWDLFGLPGLSLCSRDIRPLLGLTGEIYSSMDMLALLQRKKKEGR